jgi:hypothetical protein
MKVHTSNREKVESILQNTKVKGQFWDYTLHYEMDDTYHKTNPLEQHHYFDLPEFKWSDSLKERFIFDVHLNNEHEREVFFEMFNHKPTVKSYIHYELDPHPLEDYEYQYTHKIEPKYPIYVITKGRWEKTLTIDTLEDMGVDFRICVEPSEYDNYISNSKIDPNKVLKLPENFSERKQGGIPVRNFVWQHSIDRGFTKHWIIDDNIDGFYRWNENTQKRVRDGVFFRVMEDFSDRYENLGLVSCQYASFIPAIDCGREGFIVNTRTYSCILINTELLDQRLEERWRGTYNEDTDLTLRVLSTGDLCTVNFNSLLSGKQTTGTMKGGNTTTIYEFGKEGEDNRFDGLKKKFDELKENWGDIVKYTTSRHKDGRPHHHISYTKLFKQELKLKDGISMEPKVNNYNMIFVKKEEEKD